MDNLAVIGFSGARVFLCIGSDRGVDCSVTYDAARLSASELMAKLTKGDQAFVRYVAQGSELAAMGLTP